MNKNISNFNYLEFGRNKVADTYSGLIELDSSQYDQFSTLYNEFINEMKEDDKELGGADPIIVASNYPDWDNIVSNNLGNYLTHVLNNYLFVEFFSLYCSNDSKDFIVSVEESYFENSNLTLKVNYVHEVK